MHCSMQRWSTYMYTHLKDKWITYTFYEQMESVFLLLIFCCLFSLLVISCLQVMYQWGWLYINIYHINYCIYLKMMMIMLLILWVLIWWCTRRAPSVEQVWECVCMKMPCAESTQGHQMSIFKYFLIWKWMNVKLKDFIMGF